MTRNNAICCADCGAELNDWDKLYSWDEGKMTVWLCEDCFDRYFDDLSRDEKAEFIGSEVRTAEDFYYNE